MHQESPQSTPPAETIEFDTQENGDMQRDIEPTNNWSIAQNEGESNQSNHVSPNMGIPVAAGTSSGGRQRKLLQAIQESIS